MLIKLCTLYDAKITRGIQLSVIHNYASQYLGLVIGSEKPVAKS